MKYKFGLIGENISYTLSPLIHGEIFKRLGIDGSYGVFDIPPDELNKTVERLTGELDGFNVTKPYKQAVIELLNEDLSGCGAVNTVAVKNGQAAGYNTDGYGFMKSFLESGGAECIGKKALVLGAGGAARVVIKSLKEAGFEVYVRNRDKSREERIWREFGVLPYDGQQVAAAVNCTSCGYKSGENPAQGLELKNLSFAYDLIYSPPLTEFLRSATDQGARIKNGLDMLIYQAVRSDELILGLNLADGDYQAIRERVYSKLKADGSQV